MNRTWKQPSVNRWFTYDFSAQLAGRTISSLVGSPSDVERGSGTALTVVGVPIVAPTAVQVEWSGGVDGETHITTVKVLDSQGEQLELEGEIAIAEVEFTLPENIASGYLTGEGYVDRYGFEETVRLTDQDRKGVIDGARLQAAIDDATQLVDSYIGVRYGTPLAAPVPSIVTGFVAVLAREKLFAQRPLQAVTDAANTVRSQLKDISAGRMTLPIDLGGTVEVAATGLASWGGVIEGNVFNSETLDRF